MRITFVTFLVWLSYWEIHVTISEPTPSGSKMLPCIAPRIPNGKVFSIQDGVMLPALSKVTPGTAVGITCNSGYALQVFFSSVDRNTTFTCLANETWTGGLRYASCVPEVNYSKCGKAAQGEMPWMVKLKVEYSNEAIDACDGFLISPQWILTTAQCLKKTIKIKSYIGRTSFSNLLEQGEEIMSTSYCTHPQNIDDINDFGLVFIEKVRLGPKVRTVCLPDSASQCSKVIDGCQNVSTATWAANSRSGTLELKLMDVTVVAGCQKTNGSDHAEICVKGEDPCLDHSGGPLICATENSTLAIGVFSNSSGKCGSSGQPTVYNRICNVLPWIKALTSEAGFNCSRWTPPITPAAIPTTLVPNNATNATEVSTASTALNPSDSSSMTTAALAETVTDEAVSTKHSVFSAFLAVLLLNVIIKTII